MIDSSVTIDTTKHSRASDMTTATCTSDWNNGHLVLERPWGYWNNGHLVLERPWGYKKSYIPPNKPKKKRRKMQKMARRKQRK